jgi:hypothetical protein
MDQGSLVMQQIDSRAKLVAEFDKVRPLKAAFWLKDGEERMWYLYRASDKIDDSNFDKADAEVIQILGPDRDLWLDSFQVKVIAADKPLARDVIAIGDAYPTRKLRRVQGRFLGGMSVEDGFIYPMPVTVPA